MAFCSCFGPSKTERLEAERVQSQEARHRAAEAAQKRKEKFEKSAAGKAAIKQMAAMKQSNVSNKGDPVLKWQMG
ncbi:hypothetical protein COCNU_13G007180 [Cocos nucifera]|uniref:Small VCP/p97-interacting protein n=1 Tax=Cocos nucifera TaxID=13894 RepID=A0A8K0ITZ2_COCNU|nr:hypothetical protein COCNU_13G007180 [Cocos nucifera]